jgi:pimeloyl-ACP methyl ester carboxylesterase
MPEIEVNGLRVHYQLVGQPADRAEGTIVMIHGLAIDNLSSLYYALAPGVADRMRVVLYDLRGHGRSERPATGYGVDQAVEDLWALLDTLDIRTPVYLLGNSYGGTIALEAAHRNPERVRGLVLVEGHVAVPGWGEHIVAQLELAKFGFSVTDLSRWLSSRPQRKLATMAKVVHGLVHDRDWTPVRVRADEAELPRRFLVHCRGFRRFRSSFGHIARRSRLARA